MSGDMSTLKQVAIVAPCFLLGLVGALVMTAPNAAVQHNVRAQLVGASVAAAAIANPVFAAPTPIDVADYRNQREGYEYIYQARDLDLDEDVRAGYAQARDPSVAKARISESVSRLINLGVHPACGCL